MTSTSIINYYYYYYLLVLVLRLAYHLGYQMREIGIRSMVYTSSSPVFVGVFLKLLNCLPIQTVVRFV